MSKDISINQSLFHEIRSLIEEARSNVVVAVNAELTTLYWNIGKRINNEILQHGRAEYGSEIIKRLSNDLTMEYGKGWGEKHLRHCIRFSEIFADKEIVYTLCRQFSWSHIRLFMYIDDPLKRDFYIEINRIEKWSVRILQERINSMLFERTAISKKPEETIANDLKALRERKKVSANLVFRDPYFLDFLGLSDSYSEKDLESAVIVELQRFIIELGQDFAFLARQKRITIDNRDYYIDLLFYHRRLKCLVAIDLKIGEFEATFKGQMELYLRYLEKYEMVEGENTPVGLILCAGKNEEHIELLQLNKSNIRVADYLTQLPSKKILQTKLHKAIEIARNRLNAEEFE
jgi:predicted nuclease of restriction endonuclease-like (RecB) superfamily